MIEEIYYVEEDVLTAVPSHQLAVRMRDVDVQFWIGQGDKPLPLRVLITYKKAVQAPQFRADFDAWNFSADAAKGPFNFVPPKDSEEISLLVHKFKKADDPVPAGGAQ
jgi:hypothetical protein